VDLSAVSCSSKQVLPMTGELMVLLQGGVTLFQGEFSTPTGWLDKPLAISMFAKSAYITIERKFVSLVQINI